MSDAMAAVLHSQAIAVLYGVRALRAQPPEERGTPRGQALADLAERGAEVLVILLDPHPAASDAEPARCEAHGCAHPEDKRLDVRGMGNAKPKFLCTECGCEFQTEDA